MNILNISCDSTNYYLIECKGGYVMVDICFPNSFNKLLNLIKKLGVNPNKIKYLFITHFHPDHAGACEEIKKYGTKVVVHKCQVDFIDKMEKNFKDSDNYKKINKNDLVVADSDDGRELLKNIEIEGFLLKTPGHSDDSISLIFDDYAAFVGDLPHPLYFKDKNEKIKESWDKIYSLNIKKIYPGHGTKINL